MSVSSGVWTLVLECVTGGHRCRTIEGRGLALSGKATAARAFVRSPADRGRATANGGRGSRKKFRIDRRIAPGFLKRCEGGCKKECRMAAG